MYIPATRQWEIVADDQTPITIASGTKDILLSLRPNYLERFKLKLGLDEVLCRQPRRGLMLKRAAEVQLVSPRKTKLPRRFGSPEVTLFSPYKAHFIATPLGFEDETSAPSSPTRPCQPPSPLPDIALFPAPHSRHPLPVQSDTFPPLHNSSKAQEKNIRFPAHWLARDILEKTSQYVQQRVGNHGSFPEIFKRIYGIAHYPKTTASLLPQLYPAAYRHFSSLDYGEQATITWSRLITRFGITKKDSFGIPFIYFTHPTASPTISPTHGRIALPLGRISSQVPPPPVMSSEPLRECPLQSPNPSPDALAPRTPPPALPVMAPFPLDKGILQPLNPGPLGPKPPSELEIALTAQPDGIIEGVVVAGVSGRRTSDEKIL